MGQLTTHILDTVRGQPAVNVSLRLYRLGGEKHQLAQRFTNQDGRCDQPLLAGSDFVCGQYEIVFYVGDYFRCLGLQLPEPAFLDDIVLRFGIADVTQDYHVPLLVSPWSYTTYRGN